MARKIHVIEKADLIRRIEDNIHESGYWDIKPQTAESLIGGDIYFHRKQKEESFFGGKILAYRIHEEEDERKGRIIFRFEFSREHRNILSGSGGWSNAMKII